MNFFRRASIKRKQVLIIMAITSVALLLACGAFTCYEILTFRSAMVRNLSTLAQVIGNNTASALDFNDSKAARDTLAALKFDSHVVGARVYAADGKAFATYMRSPGAASSLFPATPPAQGDAFRDGKLTLIRPIVSNGDTVGNLYLVSDIRDLYSRLSQYAVIITAVLALTLGIALVLSGKLQYVISEPILTLATAAKAVGQKQDYSIRVKKHNPDEIGVLIDGFNGMLDQIQIRETELQKSKEVLETRVKERTIELAGANDALQKENQERKDAEMAVRRTEELYRQAIRVADAVPYGYDYRTKSYTFMDEGIERMTGYNAKEITPILWKTIIQESVMGGETAGLDKDEAAARVIGGEVHSWRCDMRVISRDGESRWICDTAVHSYDESGCFRGSIGILQDITERKQAEERLRAQEERTRLIIDQAFDAVITADCDFNIIGWNRQAENALGWPRSEILGRYLIETIIPPKRREKRRADLEQFKATGEWSDLHRLVETTALHRDGRELPVETTITPIRFGAKLIFTIFLRDITARKQAEGELEAAHRQLVSVSRQAGMAEVATSVLHNVGNVLNSINVAATLVDEQVRKSRVCDLHRVVKLIEEHADDRVAFLTTDPKGQKVPEFLAHLAKKLDSEQAVALEELAALRKNVEHVNEIIAMQQSYARVAGVFETVNVTDLLEDTLRMNAGALDRHEVKVVRDYEAAPSVCTDKHKVLQILVNLVRNAKYACDESGRNDKQLILRATTVADKVRIAVIDNGVGIPPENLARIFNHGFTTRKEGHGFGLHSGALAAQELGGSLAVYSEGQGLGAAFTLELPCQPPASRPVKGVP